MNESVGACFARVAARLPAKTAIECDGRKISFAELDFAANTIARRLLAGDTRPPARVALLFNERIASITAMLGGLKAGDAYVPLDADDPDERVQFILRDCAPLALITGNAHLERARTLIPEGCHLINIDEPGLDGMSAPLPEVAPDALAYLFYTSGSTGQPKGVCHSHRNLLYFIGRYSETLGIREDDRLSLLYSLSFSAANMDIYGGLLSGASVHTYDVRRNGIPPLAEWLGRASITILHTVPTVFRHLTGGLDRSHRFDKIRAVDLGGETVFASDVTLFRRHFREDCRLINHLAATEAMVMAQYVVHPTEPYEGVQILPAGRSPNGVKLHIQRSDGTVANVGEVGEIVVSSPFVSPGYWQRPDLNAAVFSDDPGNPGWRIYRTGDLGRIAADGNLHFLGRNGTRVKIRGQSVDLAEVESGLRQCISVRDAAAITESRDDQQEADRLVAYVVASGETDRDPRKIRRELAERLPLYMLPSVYVFLDALPLTATGKINRKALPQPGGLPGRQNDDYQPPMDDLEREIAAIYQQVLKYSPVGRTDDFFLMGGDSLSVVELKILLADLFGHNIPDVFEDATVAGVAQSNRHLLSKSSTGEQLMPVLVPLREVGTGPILFLVHGRLGQAHVSPYFLDLVGRDQALYSFQARGVDGIQAPNETIEAMAQDYVIALRQVQPHGPYFIGGLCAGGYVAIEMARLLRKEGHQVFPLLLIDPPLPFFSVQGVEVQIQTLPARIRKRSAEGHFDFDIEDPKRWKGATQVAASFENALIKYRPTPYDGPVFLLTNTQRLSSAGGWKNPSTLYRVFSGKIDCFEVGESHSQILDVHNEKFVRSLAHCIKTVRSATVEDFNSNSIVKQGGDEQTPRTAHQGGEDHYQER